MVCRCRVCREEGGLQEHVLKYGTSRTLIAEGRKHTGGDVDDGDEEDDADADHGGDGYEDDDEDHDDVDDADDDDDAHDDDDPVHPFPRSIRGRSMTTSVLPLHPFPRCIHGRTIITPVLPMHSFPRGIHGRTVITVQANCCQRIRSQEHPWAKPDNVRVSAPQKHLRPINDSIRATSASVSPEHPGPNLHPWLSAFRDQNRARRASHGFRLRGQGFHCVQPHPSHQGMGQHYWLLLALLLRLLL